MSESSFVHAVERAWQAPPRWLLLLAPLEWLFAGITALRRTAFRRGWLQRRHPGVPVIVVGNITVGGTGKTPVVIALAQALGERGRNVAVVSRGYGGSVRSPRRVEATSTAAEVGDEALLISRSIDGSVFVGADRAAVAQAAVSAGADVVIADDGLQHYALARDLEVVTMDAATGFGNGHLLPVGPLREPPRRLADVDFVLQRGGQDPHSGLSYAPARWQRLNSNEFRNIESPGFGPRVHAIAGIARPERFFDELRSLGLDPIEHALPDHGAPDAGLLESLRDAPLVMTGKDATKLTAFTHDDAWVLEMEVRFPDGFLPALVARLEQLEEPSP